MAAINERLWAAAKHGDAVKIKVLLRNPDCDALAKSEQGTTALMLTAYHGHEACLRILLPISDTLAREDDGSTALILAASYGLEACVRLLLPVSDALAKDKSGWTALMYAAYGGCESCVKLLIPASDAYAKTANGLTSSDLARKRSHLSLVQFIDAYVLAQSERANIDEAVCTVAPQSRAAPRV